MKFTKMHGAGNDFVVIETNAARHDWSRLATAMCHRHYGVGADGLLLLLPSRVADCHMRVFNSDGSEAQACGNGLRCLVKYLADKSSFEHRVRGISVETAAGIRKASIQTTAGRKSRIRLGMGEPRFGEKDIPVLIDPEEVNLVDIKSMISHTVSVDGEKLQLDLVSMGNAHAVYFLRDTVSDFPLLELGPQVEQHKMFPKGTNFEVARVINRKQIEARVWEEGVGETLACGSGACAITVAARLRGYVDNAVDIILPGGKLGVDWDGTGEVFLSGPAETVFSGEWPDGCLG